MANEGGFYIGRDFDPQSGETTSQTTQYDPDDLTTHAVVVGMTGSGKTGLCVDIMEEAALRNLPALMIDPKGDITNLLLHFPGLTPDDFQPWINADQARRVAGRARDAGRTRRSQTRGRHRELRLEARAGARGARSRDAGGRGEGAY